MKVKLGDVVKVTWEDAWSSDSYRTYDTIKNEEPLLLYTVGHVMRNDKTGISLGRELQPNLNEYRYIQHIPHGMIRKITVLK